ncbi:unnamed protein product [Trichogramma brassicae]|uniref:RNA-directed DNA polymerase n=1 Tax=Trichogramma brassicae TaxID=86971 RepID=A0A6H5IIQ2_9HYME|nr:unnamed protein product [Trichogramma brassicae]
MTNTPVRHHLQRMSPAMEAVAQAEVKQLYEAGFIERSASDWCSAPVIVRKQDGSNRFCIEYRDLNKVTLQDQYPIPNMDGILDKLRKAKYLSKVDLKNAYHQILMEEHSKPYTAFAVPGSGLCQYTRMPFGLCNAPRTFQRLIDSLFGPEDQPHIFGYLDDIIVATDSFDEHIEWLQVVLTRLREAGLAVNRKKCEFCCQRLSYLGFLLDSEGLRPDPERVAPVLECKPPRTLRELCSFLGCISWYSRFIQMESPAKIHLLKLTKKDVSWKWRLEQQEAFDNLKQSLVTAPVLARPDFTKPFKVQSDASAYAIGAVLTQEHEDGEHPIVYISRVVNKAEKNYSTTERECLAVVWHKKFFVSGEKLKMAFEAEVIAKAIVREIMELAVEEAEDNEELTESSFNVSDSTVDLDDLSALAEKEYAVARAQAPSPQHDQPPRHQLLSPPRATQQSDQQAVQQPGPQVPQQPDQQNVHLEKTVRQTAPGRTTSAHPINVERELREATNALTQAKAWAEAADAAAWRKQREAEKAMKDAKEAAANDRRAALFAAEATEQARLAAAEADEAEKAVTEAVNRRRYAERQALTGQRVVLGCLFQDVKLIRTDDSIDPQARTCFNCWQDDHERINCRKEKTRDFCFNCGRIGVHMPECPRCTEGYVRWIGRHPEKKASATKPSQAPKPEIRRPGPKVLVPPKAFLDRYPNEPERNHYDRIRKALKDVEMLTQVKILKQYFPNGAPTSEAKRFDPATQNLGFRPRRRRTKENRERDTEAQKQRTARRDSRSLGRAEACRPRNNSSRSTRELRNLLRRRESHGTGRLPRAKTECTRA